MQNKFVAVLLDDILDLRMVQQLEDEAKKAELAQILDEMIGSVKQKCVLLELKVKNWQRVLSIIDEVASNKMHKKLQKWMMEKINFYSKDALFTVDTQLTYKKTANSLGKLMQYFYPIFL